MVTRRIVAKYVCDFCRSEYNSIEEAENCEERCKHLTDSHGLEVLNLSTRTFKVLFSANICTIHELTSLTEKELLKIRGLGKFCLNEIKSKLDELG